MGDHFAAAARQLGRPVATPPKLPPFAVHVWNTFSRLANARGGTGFGPAPLSFSEIDAFCRLTGERLDFWEIDAIRELDDAYLEEAAARAKDSR